MLSLKRLSCLYSNRFMSTSSAVLEHLTNRSLIRVSGPEVSNYLQGLITNNIEHIELGPSSMFTMFLNTAGRVLYDTIIYRNLEENTFLIECDKQASETLQKHLKLYRVRRKIDITNLADDLKIYALFNNDGMKISDVTKPPFQNHQDIFIYRDPRLAELGSRVIAKADTNVVELLSDIVHIKENSEKNYRWLRYSLGVGEGVEDLPPGDCFPLECNCDYLHGVSFHKGCYIGQELTARVYHTGVIRKRLMPIHFTKVPSKSPDVKIIQENVNLGKLRGIENNIGLALLRITKALSFKEIKIGDGVGVVSQPEWWPNEAPKEKINLTKLQ